MEISFSTKDNLINEVSDNEKLTNGYVMETFLKHVKGSEKLRNIDAIMPIEIPLNFQIWTNLSLRRNRPCASSVKLIKNLDQQSIKKSKELEKFMMKPLDMFELKRRILLKRRNKRKKGDATSF